MNAKIAIKVSVVCIVLSIVSNNDKILNNLFSVQFIVDWIRNWDENANRSVLLFSLLQNENHNSAMDRANSVSMHHHFLCIRSEIRSNHTHATRPGAS